MIYPWFEVGLSCRPFNRYWWGSTSFRAPHLPAMKSSIPYSRGHMKLVDSSCGVSKKPELCGIESRLERIPDLYTRA